MRMKRWMKRGMGSEMMEKVFHESITRVGLCLPLKEPLFEESESREAKARKARGGQEGCCQRPGRGRTVWPMYVCVCARVKGGQEEYKKKKKKKRRRSKKKGGKNAKSREREVRLARTSYSR